MIKFLLSFVLLAISSAALAQNALLENLDQKVKKNWRLSLSATHFGGFGDTRLEPSTLLSAALSYKLADRLHLDFSVRGTKVYFVDFDTENEFKMSDSFVTLRHDFKDKFFEGRPILTYGFSLPFSEFSRRNGIRTKVYVGASNSWMLFSKLLTLTAGLDALYFVNEYTTRNISAGGSGGSTLPLVDASGALSASLALGNALGFKTKFMKSLYLSARGSYTRTTYEDFKPQALVTTPDLNNTKDSYNLSATLSASPFKNWYASVGYGQNDFVEQMGRTEYYLFDSLSTKWRVGLRYSLRF